MDIFPTLASGSLSVTAMLDFSGKAFAGSPVSHSRHARGTFDNHGQINDAVSLQPIHTPDLFIYINNDLI